MDPRNIQTQTVEFLRIQCDEVTNASPFDAPRNRRIVMIASAQASQGFNTSLMCSPRLSLDRSNNKSVRGLFAPSESIIPRLDVP